MKRNTVFIGTRVELRLVERIDAWRARQRVPLSRSAAIVRMIECFLANDEPPDAETVWEWFLNKM
jgi:hypothetical protein